MAQLRDVAGLAVESNPGTVAEHLDFNTGATAMPLLREPWFRRAVAFALDRETLVTRLFAASTPTIRPQNNLSYLAPQPEYQPSFEQYVYNRDAVADLMRRHGCTRGGDGIWSCDGMRASIRLGTTAGNRLRELAVEELQRQARDAGIELVADNSPSRAFFPRVAALDYDLALFGWVLSGDPAGQLDVYGCGAPSNWKAYCSDRVTKLLAESEAEIDPRKRASLVNKADRILADDVPTLPLYQKPTFFAFKTTLHGLRDNPSLQGPTWNVEDWWMD